MTLTGTVRIEEVLMREDGRAVVTTRGTLHDADRDLVVALVGEGLFAARPPSG